MSDKAAKKIYRIHKKLNVVYHPESTLVVKSKDEKIAIGRIENDAVVNLDEETLRLCEEHGIDYDHSLVEEEDSEEENASKEENASEEEEQEEQSDDEPQQEEKPVPATTVAQPVSTQSTIAQTASIVASVQPVSSTGSVESVEYDSHLRELKRFIDSLVAANEEKKAENVKLASTVASLHAEIEKLKKTNRALLATIAEST